MKSKITKEDIDSLYPVVRLVSCTGTTLGLVLEKRKGGLQIPMSMQALYAYRASVAIYSESMYVKEVREVVIRNESYIYRDLGQEITQELIDVGYIVVDGFCYDPNRFELLDNMTRLQNLLIS